MFFAWRFALIPLPVQPEHTVTFSKNKTSLLTDRKRDLAEILSNYASHLVVEPALSLSQCPDDVFCVCANIVRLERTQIALELLLRLGKDYNLSLSVRSTMGGRNANEQSYR